MATLQGKTALVTGASRGIGRATAMALADAGARVLVHYRRAVADAKAVVVDIRNTGGHADALEADLAAADGPAVLAKHAREILNGRLDILVLNAGISKAGPIENHTIDDFDNLFSTNVRSPFFLVQHLLPLLGEGSNIIFVSSLAAHTVPGNPGQPGAPFIPAYASTKGAVETLAKHLAAILGPRGIRVNAVAPGVINTDMSNFTKTEAGRDLALGMQALKRIGKPDDVADVIAFLASDAARWITGASIPVDQNFDCNLNLKRSARIALVIFEHRRAYGKPLRDIERSSSATKADPFQQLLVTLPDVRKAFVRRFCSAIEDGMDCYAPWPMLRVRCLFLPADEDVTLLRENPNGRGAS